MLPTTYWGKQKQPMISGSVIMFNFTTSIHPPTPPEFIRLDPEEASTKLCLGTKKTDSKTSEPQLKPNRAFFTQKNNWHYGRRFFLVSVLFFLLRKQINKQPPCFLGCFVPEAWKTLHQSRELESRLIFLRELYWITPLKTNMKFEKIPMFNRKSIFKWWMFHCHVSFLGCIFPKPCVCLRNLGKIPGVMNFVSKKEYVLPLALFKNPCEGKHCAT